MARPGDDLEDFYVSLQLKRLTRRFRRIKLRIGVCQCLAIAGR
jgi:hypothetical protein